MVNPFKSFQSQTACDPLNVLVGEPHSMKVGEVGGVDIWPYVHFVVNFDTKINVSDS
jgi:hypothetical protein